MLNLLIYKILYIPQIPLADNQVDVDVFMTRFKKNILGVSGEYLYKYGRVCNRTKKNSETYPHTMKVA